MTDIIIVKADGNNVSDIGVVHYQAWYDAYKNVMCKDFLDYNTQEKLMNDAKYKINTTYIAKINEKVCGFLFYKLVEGKIIEIHELYILKEHKNLGIGTKLINHLINEQHPVDEVFLWVLRKNALAIKFYERQGFRKTNNVDVVKVNDSTIYYVDCYKKIL